MNYADLVKTVSPQVMDAMKAINNPEIAPEVRQLNQEILLREVGKSVYNKIYDMNAFDMNIEHTSGAGIDERYYGLAKVASNSVSNGDVGLQEYINNYLNYAATKAQSDATTNSRQSGGHPRVTRTEHAKACKWCKSLEGTYDDPPADVFKRHGGCEGQIVTEGYKTRNGQLGNYKKGEPITVYRGEGKNAVPGTDMFGRAHYVARDAATAKNFGTVHAETLTINPKQIYTIASEPQYQALVRDALREYAGVDPQIAIPKLLLNRGFKAVEGTPEFDPLAGIAVLDPKLISQK